MARKTSKPVQQAIDETIRKLPLEPIVTPPSEYFKDALYRELKYMEQGKKEAKRQPGHTLFMELQRHISDTLNDLYKNGRIKTGQTINDKYIITQ